MCVFQIPTKNVGKFLPPDLDLCCSLSLCHNMYYVMTLWYMLASHGTSRLEFIVLLNLQQLFALIYAF